jgi:hypothetical protein
MKLGAFDYFTKPCYVNYLVAKVQDAKNVKTQREDKIPGPHQRN